MTTLVLGTSAGNIYIYDLPKALENERILCRKRAEMGVEDNLIFTYLERSNLMQMNDYIKNQTTTMTIKCETSIVCDE